MPAETTCSFTLFFSKPFLGLALFLLFLWNSFRVYYFVLCWLGSWRDLVEIHSVYLARTCKRFCFSLSFCPFKAFLTFFMCIISTDFDIIYVDNSCYGFGSVFIAPFWLFCLFDQVSKNVHLIVTHLHFCLGPLTEKKGPLKSTAHKVRRTIK